MPVRILEALFLRPYLRLELAFYVRPDFLERRGRLHPPSVLHDQLMHPSGRTAGVDEGPPRPLRIDVRVIPAEVGSLLRQGDQVGDGVALAVIDAPHLFLPGVGYLFEGLRDLYLGVAGLALLLKIILKLHQQLQPHLYPFLIIQMQQSH